MSACEGGSELGGRGKKREEGDSEEYGERERERGREGWRVNIERL